MGFLSYFDTHVGSLLVSAMIGFMAGAVLFIKRAQLALSRQRLEAQQARPARRC